MIFILYLFLVINNSEEITTTLSPMEEHFLKCIVNIAIKHFNFNESVGIISRGLMFSRATSVPTVKYGKFSEALLRAMSEAGGSSVIIEHIPSGSCDILKSSWCRPRSFILLVDDDYKKIRPGKMVRMFLENFQCIWNARYMVVLIEAIYGKKVQNNFASYILSSLWSVGIKDVIVLLTENPTTVAGSFQI